MPDSMTGPVGRIMIKQYLYDEWNENLMTFQMIQIASKRVIKTTPDKT